MNLYFLAALARSLLEEPNNSGDLLRYWYDSASLLIMPRHFNTAGPCKPDIHYTLSPLARLPNLEQLIEQQNYFGNCSTPPPLVDLT